MTPRTWRLRLTRQALKDLDLRGWKNYVGFDADDLIDEHWAIAAFVDKRSKSPTGQERMGNSSGSVVYNLHFRDGWRGETWHDPENNVVWLCAVTKHDYGEFEARARNGKLLPQEEDYLDLFSSDDAVDVSSEAFLRQAASQRRAEGTPWNLLLRGVASRSRRSAAALLRLRFSPSKCQI